MIAPLAPVDLTEQRLTTVDPNHRATVMALLQAIRDGEEVYRRRLKDAREAQRLLILQAVEDGGRYEMLRGYFPPRSGWEAWVAVFAGTSPKTITRKRRLYLLFQSHRELYQMPMQRVGVGMLYKLAAAATPAAVVEAVLTRMATDDEPITQAQLNHIIQSSQANTRTNMNDSVAETTPAENDAAETPPALLDFIETYALSDPLTLSLLRTIFYNQPDLFASLQRSGTIWSASLNRSISIGQAGTGDFMMALQHEEAEQYLTWLEAKGEGMYNHTHRRYMRTLKGDAAAVDAQLRALPADRQYMVVVYELDAPARRLTPPQ